MSLQYCQEFDKLDKFHKMYASEPCVASELDQLSALALDLAASHIKDAKIIVLESLLLEAFSQLDSSTGDHKRARSAIALQKVFYQR